MSTRLIPSSPRRVSPISITLLPSGPTCADKCLILGRLPIRVISKIVTNRCILRIPKCFDLPVFIAMNLPLSSDLGKSNPVSEIL